MNRFVKSVVLSAFLFKFSVGSAFAVDIIIGDHPASITTDQFNVSVLVNGPNDGTNYLRVDLYKESSTNYFGETFNNSEWYSGGDGIKYFPITIQNSSGSAVLQARIGNPSQTEYLGSGIYKLKIRRYTSSGSVASNDNQTPVDIQINYSLPTPTSTPTLSPTQAPTQKPATPSPTVKPTLKPTDKPLETNQPEVLSAQTIEPSSTPNVKSAKTKNPLLVIFASIIVIGIVFIGVAGYLAYKIQYNNKNVQEN